MRIRVNRAHHPVTVLGFGRRAGIWLQGCSLGCPGCMSNDTWPDDPTREIPIDVVVDWCRGLPENDVDGVTISGGEPFEQPEALQTLLTELRPWADAASRDLLCYSGFGLSVLRRRHRSALALLDAVITGRYVAGRAPGYIWRGSANQRLVPLTPLGHARYDEQVHRPAPQRRLQATVDGSTVRYVGVPHPGDLKSIDAALSRRGLEVRERSWLT